MGSPGPRIPFTLNTLERMKLRVKHGVMKPNGILECLRRHPPPLEPPNRDLKEVEFPWERLEKAFDIRRDEEGVASPYIPVEAPELDPAAEFARRQLKRMDRFGEDEETARAAVDKQFAAEKAEAIQDIAALRAACRAWHRGRAGAPFSDERLRAWAEIGSRLDAKPFHKWTTEEQTDVDSFLAASLGLDWRLERTLDEEAAYLETWGPPEKEEDKDKVSLAMAMVHLRVEAFWPKLVDPLAFGTDPERLNTDPADPPLDTSPSEFYVDGPDDDDDDDDDEEDQGVTGLGPEFDVLQARAEAKPLTDWTPDEVEALDAWLRANIIEGDKIGVFDASGRVHIDGNAIPIERLRLELFPELSATYKRRAVADGGAEGGGPREAPTATARPDGDADASAADASAAEATTEGGATPASPDEAADAAYAGAPVMHVRSYKDPDKIRIALARAGQFPDMSAEEILRHDEACLSDEDKFLPDDVAEALRDALQPDSHEMRRANAARTGYRDMRFMDRIYRRYKETDPFEIAWEREQNKPGAIKEDNDEFLQSAMAQERRRGGGRRGAPGGGGGARGDAGSGGGGLLGE